MAELIRPLHAEAIAKRLREAKRRIDAAATAAGRDSAEVEILVAGKYVASEDLGELAEAGVRLIGENRAQDLEAKVERWGETFAWDFIGQLQSRKVKAIVPYVRIVHSLASASAVKELTRWQELARPGLEVLVEVNVSGEEGKAGVVPSELDALIESCPVAVTGLMTMPPSVEDPEHNRPFFAALAALAYERGLPRLSMGTSQDYEVAVQEGSTIVRLGRSLLA